MKKCNSCGNTYPLNMFHRSTNKDGLTGSCKECINKKTSLYKKTKDGVITSMYANQRWASKKRGHPHPEYTKEQLSDWLFSQQLFHDLYNQWVDSGYNTKLKPSVDRIDDYIHYCFSNIEIVTWGENRKRSFQSQKKCKSVKQFNSQGIHIGGFKSIQYAVFCTDASEQGVIKCCKEDGMTRTSGGSKWAYR